MLDDICERFTHHLSKRRNARRIMFPFSPDAQTIEAFVQRLPEYLTQTTPDRFQKRVGYFVSALLQASPDARFSLDVDVLYPMDGIGFGIQEKIVYVKGRLRDHTGAEMKESHLFINGPVRHFAGEGMEESTLALREAGNNLAKNSADSIVIAESAYDHAFAGSKNIFATIDAVRNQAARRIQREHLILLKDILTQYQNMNNIFPD
jgi:hypothetical protein